MKISLSSRSSREMSSQPSVSSLRESLGMGGYYRHVYLLKDAIDNMTERGLPISTERLAEFKSWLEEVNREVRERIQSHIDSASLAKGIEFHSYHPSSEGYKVLPQDLREIIGEREIIQTTTEIKRKRTYVESEGKNRMIPTEIEVPVAKYPCRGDLYQEWFYELVDEHSEYEWKIISQEGIYAIVKRVEFNPNSTQQLEFYCSVMGYTIPTATKKTVHGREQKQSLDDKALQKLGKLTKDPIFGMIETLREVGKLISTYVEGWKPNRADGRLHSEFSLNSGTGQLRSRKPNVQNAPSHSGEYGKKFKKIIKAREGRLILNCVAPGTKVLMRDLTWKNAEDILPGDSLVGFDEHPVNPTNRRYFKTSIVEQVAIQKSPRLYLRTDMGDIIISPDHKFIKRLSGRGQWIEASKLKVGDKISFFTQPWETENTYKGGWLAGFLDGEGYLGNGGGNKWAGYKSTGLGFGQNDGYAADRAVEIFADLGYVMSVSANRKCKQYHVSSRLSKAPYAWLRAVGQLRPVRLLPKAMNCIEGLATWGTASKPATILQVYQYAPGPVVAVKTTTSTLITNGFLSHNCDYTGYHALMLGYFAESAEYMRLSRYGVHDYLAAHMLKNVLNQAQGNHKSRAWQDCRGAMNYYKEGEDYERELLSLTENHLSDLSEWLLMDDDSLKARLKWVKKSHDYLRNKKSKPICHSIGFGAQANGIYEKNEDSFSGRKEVEALRDLYFQTFPAILKYQKDIVRRAHEEKKLVSPFGYVRRFYEAMTLKNGVLSNGEQASEVIAFFPANTAFGIKKEAILALESSGWNERFCFFNEVHDSLMYEPLENEIELAAKVVAAEMTKPCPLLTHPTICPNGLVCDVEVSWGPSWGELEEYKI